MSRGCEKKKSEVVKNQMAYHSYHKRQILNSLNTSRCNGKEIHLNLEICLELVLSDGLLSKAASCSVDAIQGWLPQTQNQIIILYWLGKQTPSNVTYV